MAKRASKKQAEQEHAHCIDLMVAGDYDAAADGFCFLWRNTTDASFPNGVRRHSEIAGQMSTTINSFSKIIDDPRATIDQIIKAKYYRALAFEASGDSERALADQTFVRTNGGFDPRRSEAEVDLYKARRFEFKLKGNFPNDVHNLYRNLSSEKQQAFDQLLVLEDGEIPLFAILQDGQDCILLSTRRVMFSARGVNHKLSYVEIQRASIQKPDDPNNFEKTALGLVLFDSRGNQSLIDLKRGGSFVACNMIRFMCVIDEIKRRFNGETERESHP